MHTASKSTHLPAVLQEYSLEEYPPDAEVPHAGMVCPFCKQGSLDYNGVLELFCPVCGYKWSGGAGCT